MNIYRPIIIPLLIAVMLFGCNSNKAGSDNPTTDTAGTNPTNSAQDYHPDQRQSVPTPDSSNIVGTDSIGASEATPNTGTVKAENDKKGTKDSTQKH